MSASEPSPAWRLVGTDGDGEITVVELDGAGAEISRAGVTSGGLIELARTHTEDVRWVWSDTARWYPPLLAAGVRVRRVHDLRAVRAILRTAESVPESARLPTHAAWSAPAAWEEAPDSREALFEVQTIAARDAPPDLASGHREFAAQLAALDAASGRLRLLAVAESTGALVAAEMRAAGLPWDVATHTRLLDETLGERVGGSRRHVDAAAAAVRTALDDPDVALDSPPRLLRALHRAGLAVSSTSKWELEDLDHPVVAPLLAYKRLMRLLTSNGESWIATWVHGGRFRPVYVPSGVVTGRWASSGGGALQIPRSLRPAVRADPGWLLVSADVAQLEPRVLAGMSRDRAMARAAAGTDLYAGIVSTGVVTTRQEAKIAVLGAMYGATTGDSGRLVPRLRRAFPAAMRLVDDAAVAGEEGRVVSTWLGRTSPSAGSAFTRSQFEASLDESDAATEQQARRRARDRGRFTRNYVVQGTAAEWALCWLAATRRSLLALTAPGAEAAASGPAQSGAPHIAFFLHDEIIVHTPAELADQVAAIVTDAAARAGRLLFGEFPIDFPLDVRIAPDAGKS